MRDFSLAAIYNAEGFRMLRRFDRIGARWKCAGCGREWSDYYEHCPFCFPLVIKGRIISSMVDPSLERVGSRWQRIGFALAGPMLLGGSVHVPSMACALNLYL